jgi:glycosyltransferase involved in cell wall biosynthesis
MVADGVSGYLVDPGDDATLADRLESLVVDPELARSMGRAGRTYFEEHFTLAKFEVGFERILLEAHDGQV